MNLLLLYLLIVSLYYGGLLITTALDPGGLHEIRWVALNVFLLLEFILFVIFIRIYTTNDDHSRALLFFLQLYPLVVGYSWLYNHTLHEAQPFVTLTGSALVLSGCLLFFRELPDKPPDKPLSHYFPFQAISGIFILSAMDFALSACFFKDEALLLSLLTLGRSLCHLIFLTTVILHLPCRNIFRSSFLV